MRSQVKRRSPLLGRRKRAALPLGAAGGVRRPGYTPRRLRHLWQLVLTRHVPVALYCSPERLHPTTSQPGQRLRVLAVRHKIQSRADSRTNPDLPLPDPTPAHHQTKRPPFFFDVSRPAEDLGRKRWTPHLGCGSRRARVMCGTRDQLGRGTPESITRSDPTNFESIRRGVGLPDRLAWSRGTAGASLVRW